MAVYVECLPATKSNKHAAVRWTPPADLFAAGVVEIQQTRGTCRYAVTEFECGPGYSGRGFHLEKLDGEKGSDATETGYDVYAAGRAGSMCCCRGFSRYSACKHLAAVEAILSNGWM